MRFTLMGTAAAVLTATTLLAVPASADRICKKVCHEGFCRSTCVQRSDRLYMHGRDVDVHRRPEVDIDVHRRRGVDIDVGR